jgi:hypothetical protein
VLQDFTKQFIILKYKKKFKTSVNQQYFSKKKSSSIKKKSKGSKNGRYCRRRNNNEVICEILNVLFFVGRSGFPPTKKLNNYEKILLL